MFILGGSLASFVFLGERVVSADMLGVISCLMVNKSLAGSLGGSSSDRGAWRVYPVPLP